MNKFQVIGICEWLLDLLTFVGFYLIAAYCIMVEFYVDRIRRYNGFSRMEYLLKTIKESKFINTSNRKLIAVITGANGTIGTEITRLLLQNDFKVVCLIRNCDNSDWLDSSEYQPNLVVQHVDLSNLWKVKETAKLLAKEYPHMDLIICGAGIMLQPFKLTTDGFETHCAVNLLSHAVMVNYLLPHITKYSVEESCIRDNRIVFLSSATAHLGIFTFMLQDNFQMFYTYRNGYQAYSSSKFALSLYVEEMNKQMQQKSTMANQQSVTAISMHPGCVASGLYEYANALTKIVIFRFLFPIMRNPALAAAETVALGCADNLKSGCYYQHMSPTRILCSTAKKQQLYQHVRNIITNMEEKT
uniref:Dehydrogenase/reductase SDR family member on chromosome X n=1 Tax=Elaeophora elaphi TaxID=1147741 RepID=A0A0R3RRE5_9BILA